MELRTLRSFLAVAREGNVTRAARVLHITQPALSRQLKELEQEFGCELLIRESRGVVLTEDGMQLRKRAEEILSLADRTEQEMRSPTTEITGDVLIGCGESRVNELVAKAARKMMRDHPAVRLRMHSGNGTDVLERVEKGLLDFGLVMGMEIPKRYESIEMPWEDDWGVLVRHDHPLAGRSSVGLEDLRDVPLIVSAQSAASNEEADSSLEFFNTAGCRIVATYTLLYNASLLVEQGVGVAVCLDGIIPVGETTPFLFVPLIGVQPVRSHLIWKRFQPLSRACALFLSTLQEEL